MTLATFLSQPVVWGTSILEVFTLPGIIAVFLTAYHHVECHMGGCHRLGRFEHGQYKLCAVHHPKVPSNGKVTTAHINAATKENPS